MSTTVAQIANLRRLKETGAVIEVELEVTVSEYRGQTRTFRDIIEYEDVNPTAEGFVEYTDLTEEIVLGWLTDKITQLEARVKANIDHILDYIDPYAMGKPW